MSSLPSILKALQRRKVTPKGALAPHKLAKDDRAAIDRIYHQIDDRVDRYELNLYVVGEEEEQEAAGEAVQSDAAGAQLPAERSPNT